MKNLLIAVAFFAFFADEAKSQTSIYNTFYRNNWQFLNPASLDPILRYRKNSDGGSRDISNKTQALLNFQSRGQWFGSGISDAPRFLLAGFEYSPLGQDFRAGGAVNIDQTGAFQRLSFFGNASYRFTPWDKKSIFVGFGIEYTTTALDFSKIRLADNNPIDRDLIAQNFEKQSVLRAPLGAFYLDNNNGWYFGLALPTGLWFDLKKGNDRSVLQGFRQPSVNLMLGKWHFIDKDGQNRLEPTLWMRWADGLSYSTLVKKSPFAADLGCRYYHGQPTHSFAWFGLGTGSNKQFHVESGISRLYGDKDLSRRWSLGMSYGCPLPGENRLRVGSSLELNLQFSWK